MSNALTATRAPQRGELAPTATGSNALYNAHQQGATGLAAICSNAEVTQVMASIYIAQQFPRDMVRVTQTMQEVCSRPRFAEKALYSYPRGGTSVTGPSIRLAEALMSAWGNMETGWKEVGRHKVGTLTMSDCVAFAFDKQTNVRQEVSFTVPHWRDTKNGGNELKDERDIYEMCANMAARRRRACILAIIPSWVVDEAVDMVNTALKADMPAENIKDTARKLEAGFASVGVTREMLEAKLGHSLDECTRGELAKMRREYTAIDDGYVNVSDIFPVAEAPANAPMQAAVPPAKTAKAMKPAKPAAKVAKPAPEEIEGHAPAEENPLLDEELGAQEMLDAPASPEELAALDKLDGIVRGSGKTWNVLYKVCDAIGFSHPAGGASRDTMAVFARYLLDDPEARKALEESGFILK